jgi:hypothetical protein
LTVAFYRCVLGDKRHAQSPFSLGHLAANPSDNHAHHTLNPLPRACGQIKSQPFQCFALSAFFPDFTGGKTTSVNFLGLTPNL